MNILSSYADNIIDLCLISNFKADNAPTAAEKREAAFEIGENLKNARGEFGNNDVEFGKWIDEHIHTDQCKVPTKTLYRYRMLVEFTPSMETAIKVGYTNIYKLMASEHEEFRVKLLSEIAVLNNTQTKTFIKEYFADRAAAESESEGDDLVLDGSDPRDAIIQKLQSELSDVRQKLESLLPETSDGTDT